ncbi:MAG: hypothetical protein PW789_16235 [Edaphobacter sp.]|uniref:hypothetical protein n=1 Tax=Edaphobacter sp. TaxID=1934404 RepID=UPI0023A14D55|nr:hypothetical protein [Edaphobacter sp.]MDE1178127.1 hypothetical protein [Edaphobacter sp.]
MTGRPKPKRLWVAITDHYEPLGGKVSMDVANARVDRWTEAWPRIAAAAPRDAAGKQPCYSFFYPQEEYRYELLAPLAEMTRSGIGDVEVHIHHRNETRDGFIQKITDFCRTLRNDHGLLHDHNGQMVFGFIHGNWALDNSRPDGLDCGLTGEIALLRDLGCYADFTMPSLPSPTQGHTVNQVYWASQRYSSGQTPTPKSFDHGIEATPGGGCQGDLLMITGPVALRFAGRLVPRVEMGEIAHNDIPTLERVRLWLDHAPQVGEDAFVKVYTHGAREDNADTLLGTATKPSGLAGIFQWFHQLADERGIELHWASAYDMFRAVEAQTGPLTPGPRLETAPAGAIRA